MAFPEENDLINEGVRVGWPLILVRTGAVAFLLSYVLLFIYAPMAWAVVTALVFAFAIGLFVTTFLFGIQDRKLAFKIAPVVGLAALAGMWFYYKSQTGSGPAATAESNAPVQTTARPAK